MALSWPGRVLGVVKLAWTGGGVLPAGDEDGATAVTAIWLPSALALAGDPHVDSCWRSNC